MKLRNPSASSRLEDTRIHGVPGSALLPEAAKILVPVDLSPLSRKAVDAAVLLAGNRTDLTIHLAHVVNTPSVDETACPVDDPHLLLHLQHAATALADLTADYRARIRFRTRIFAGVPAQTLCDVSRDEGFDLIVLSSHGQTGLPEMTMGSVADDVVQQSPVSVLVVKPRIGETGLLVPAALSFKNLLVGYNHDCGSERALKVACELAGQFHGRITLVQALETHPALAGEHVFTEFSNDDTCVREALTRLRGVGARHVSVPESMEARAETGPPWQVITRLATTMSADLIIVGPHETTRWGHSFSDCSAACVARLATSPVLAVK